MPTETDRTKCHVLFVLNSLGGGGAERQVVSLLNGMDDTRFTRSLAILGSDYTLLPEIRPDGVREIVRCEVGGRLDWKAVWQLADYVDSAGVDIAVCTNQYAMLYGYFAVRKARRRCRLVEVLHTLKLVNLYERIKSPLYRQLFKRCDLVIFVSRKQKAHWLGKCRLAVKKNGTVHNGIDVSHFAPLESRERRSLRLRLGFSDRDFVVGVCAELRPEKRHPDVVDAVAALRDEGRHAKLLIIGDGPERTRVEERIRRFGLESRVRLVGFQQDVRPYLGSCDCSVVASETETFSLAILESMAMEVPVVSSKIGGAEEQIENGSSGYLFPAGDVAALTGCLEKLANAELRERVGRAGRSKVARLFTIERMVEGYQEVFAGFGRVD